MRIYRCCRNDFKKQKYGWQWQIQWRTQDLHNLVEIPQYRIIVVFFGWIKPQINAMFFVSLPSCVHICLQNVWLPWSVSQELEIYFVVLRVLRRQLNHQTMFRVNKSTSQEWQYSLLTYIESSDSSSWISRNHFNLHTEVPK